MNDVAVPGRIGKYPVLRELGRGATSVVYLCNDPFYSRNVAVKVVMPDAFQDADRGKLYRKLFVTEASLAGKLQHPHICQIYDAVADDKLHYIVMEFVDGGTLERHGDAQDLLPIDRVVEIVFKCTRALDFAHKMGITHRDLKPANILYTGETDVKISDFGAALIASGDVTQVSAIGSPAYMSPEQVKEHALNHQTDIYSLGVVLYQLLAGEITQGKLIELEDLSQPLLKQISEKAPGTWQHSLMMANLAEIAARGFIFRIMLVIFEPGGWFIFWTGLDEIYLGQKEKLPEHEFYHKMASVDIRFFSY